MIVFAHRGAPLAPNDRQNTMAVFREAASSGWGIETDLRSTSDGEVVLFHDRCFGGVPVEETSRYDLETAVGHDVPTLDDLLDADLGVPLNLDVKTGTAFALALPSMMAARDRIVLVSAFNHDTAIAAAAAGLPSGYLMASRPQFDAPLPPRRMNLDTIVFDYDMIDQELVDRVRLKGMSIVSYGAITRAEQDRLKAMGVAATITDRPDRA
jgi:glycerophosphoryl diester phosphodiesterase